MTLNHRDFSLQVFTQYELLIQVARLSLISSTRNTFKTAITYNTAKQIFKRYPPNSNPNPIPRFKLTQKKKYTTGMVVMDKI